MNSAQKHSEYQASMQRMTHESPVPLFDRFTQVGFNAQAVAENVAMMSSFSIESVMRLWIGSPGTFTNVFTVLGHFANILGDYSFFGSGVAKGADGRFYWTQHFARPFRNAFEPCMGESGTPVRPVTSTTRPANPVVVVTVTVTASPHSPSQDQVIPWHWPWRKSPFRHRNS